MAQQLARMTLAGLPRGGGDGDAIRHGILNVMRENGIREGHRPVSPFSYPHTKAGNPLSMPCCHVRQPLPVTLINTCNCCATKTLELLADADNLVIATGRMQPAGNIWVGHMALAYSN